MRAICEEKVVTITPDFDSSVPMSASITRSLAIFSEGVFPEMEAFVVSVMSARTPSFPRALKPGKVWRLSQRRRAIDLVVIGVDYGAFWSVYGSKDAIDDAVLNANELQFDILRNLKTLSSVHGLEGIINSEDLLGLDLLVDEIRCERRGNYWSMILMGQFRDGTNMIQMTMRTGNRPYLSLRCFP